MQVIIGKCLLHDLLKSRHMTPTELAEKTGISINQLSRYLNNKSKMSLQTAMLISWVLKCHIDELYEYKVIGVS